VDCSTQKSPLSLPNLDLPSLSSDLINIEKVKYKTNKKASYCKRPTEMIDTIVIHHSGTSSKSTPEEINDYHVNRVSGDDLWYMIGYSFIINSPYAGNKVPPARVTEGRPMDIVGSHAGSGAFVSMNEEQQKIWDENKILCGKEGGVFSKDLSLINGGNIKANVTTIGVVVMGNYAPFDQYNPGGYSRNRPRHPTPQTLDMIARLSCQIQKTYPKIKTIKWHSFYKDTDCPGDIKLYIDAIIKLTKEYGCEFN